jgi:hypothetical protein
MSNKQGDTLYVLMTGGMTNTSTAAPAEKISDGAGRVWHKGQFHSTTDYYGQGFGASTGYEFCIAPHVQYTLQASQAKPTDTIVCPFDQVTYTNTSSWRMTSKYYNLVEFKRAWNQNPSFHSQAIPTYPIIPFERGVNWFLNSFDFESFTYTPSGNGVITFTVQPPQNTIVCHPGSEFKAVFQGMNIRGGTVKFLSTEEFNICKKYCPGAGISEEGMNGRVSAYPNPCEGLIRIEGLEGKAVLQVSDLSGMLFRETVIEDDDWIDLEDLPAGAYFLSVQQPAAATVMKLLRR